MKQLYKIQEKYVEQDWQDAQVNLNMLEEVWQKAQKELLEEFKQLYLDTSNKIPTLDWIAKKKKELKEEK